MSHDGLTSEKLLAAIYKDHDAVRKERMELVRTMLRTCTENADLRGVYLLLGHPDTAHFATDEICCRSRESEANPLTYAEFLAGWNETDNPEKAKRMTVIADVMREAIRPHQIRCRMLAKGMGWKALDCEQ